MLIQRHQPGLLSWPHCTVILRVTDWGKGFLIFWKATTPLGKGSLSGSRHWVFSQKPSELIVCTSYCWDSVIFFFSSFFGLWRWIVWNRLKRVNIKNNNKKKNLGEGSLKYLIKTGFSVRCHSWKSMKPIMWRIQTTFLGYSRCHEAHNECWEMLNPVKCTMITSNN